MSKTERMKPENGDLAKINTFVNHLRSVLHNNSCASTKERMKQGICLDRGK